MMIFPLISLISVILIILNFILAKKDYLEREKPSPFECGFDPISSARLPFSIQFFLIAVIFLIFDIELTLILPAITSLLTCNISIISMVLSLFLAILMAGLLLEWKLGALEWYI